MEWGQTALNREREADYTRPRVRSQDDYAEQYSAARSYGGQSIAAPGSSDSPGAATWFTLAARASWHGT
jgi:hypothetical protein